jgi:hypothetical protein
MTQEKLTQKITGAGSWGDMLRSIEFDKRKELNMDEFRPVKRVTMFEVCVLLAVATSLTN